MAATQWNDDEDAVLQYLPHRAQVLYLRCLRRFMDYSSGVVGREPKELSMQAFQECLEVASRFTSNNKRCKPSPKEVRVSLGHLERVGLIVRLQGRQVSKLVHTYVFSLPLATLGFSVENSQGEVRAQSGRTSQGTHQANSGEGFEASQGEVRSQSGRTSQGIHQESGKQVKQEILTTAVDNLPRAGVDPDFVPLSRQDWFVFFGAPCGRKFDPVKLRKSAKTLAMIERCVELKVSQGVMLEAMVMAEEGRTEPIAVPAYYAWAVKVVLEKDGLARGDGDGSGQGGKGQGRGRSGEKNWERSERKAAEYLADLDRREGEEAGGDASGRTLAGEVVGKDDSSVWH